MASSCVLDSGQQDEATGEAASALTPTDPGFAQQWGLNNAGQNISAPSGNPMSQVGTPHVDINLSKAWDVTRGSPSVIVAVIDEGMVRIDHEDLSARIFTNLNEVPGDGIDNDHNGVVDAQAGATRYDVEVDGGAIANGTATSYVHSGLAADSMHIYRVRAAFGGTVGPWSYRWIKRASAAPLTASLSVGTAHSYSNNSTRDFYVPAKNAISMRVHFAKIDVAITPDDPSHDCVFYSPSEQEGVDQCDSNYVLRGKYPSGLWTRFGRVPFSVHFESDAAGTAYGFAIDKIEYLTGIPEQPPAPFAFAVSATSLSVSVSPSSGAEKVNVYRSLSSGGSYSKIATLSVASNGNAPDYANTGLSAGTTYYYKTSSTNGLGESPLSAFAAATP